MEMEVDANQEVVHIQQSLSDWRHIIVEADMWLRWDQESYPYMMCGAVSVFFLLFWLIQPPILTTVSLVIMVVCLLDFLVPGVFKEYFNRQAWSAYKQERFEKCCSQLLSTKNSLISVVSWTVDLRQKKPKHYFFGASLTLLTIAFIGSAIPGLLLAYLLAIFLVLLPGMIYHGILAKYYALLLQVFVDMVKRHRKKKD